MGDKDQLRSSIRCIKESSTSKDDHTDVDDQADKVGAHDRLPLDHHQEDEGDHQPKKVRKKTMAVV